MSNRCTKQQKEERLVECQKLLLLGYTRREIHVHFNTQYGYSTHNTDNYITLAKEAINADIPKDITELRNWVVANLINIHRDAALANNNNARLGALNQLQKLFGLNEIKVTHTVINDDQSITDEQLLQQMRDADDKPTPGTTH